MGGSTAESGSAAGSAGRDVNQSLPAQMEMLTLRDQKSQQHMQENLADIGSPALPSKSIKMYENLANNQKLPNPVAVHLPKVYPGIESTYAVYMMLQISMLFIQILLP